MFELSLHILDLVQNSITAGATLVTITIEIDRINSTMRIVIEDDGCGMDKALLARVVSPFATTRTTRKVGLGIPMLKQLCEQCAGHFLLDSAPGEGTRLQAQLDCKSIDLPPLGDLAGTMQTLVLGAPVTPDFVLTYTVDGSSFFLDTREIRTMLEGVALSEPDVIGWIGDYVKEGMAEAALSPSHPDNNNLEV